MFFCGCFFFFFFSSRRRHTRCGRDWSSDVCSSDLKEQAAYARMWGWSRAWVCKNWKRIEEEAARWRSFYSTDGSERSVNDESTAREQNSGANERKLPIPAQKRHVSESGVNAELTRSERSVNTYLEEPSDQQNKEEEKRLLETARARGRRARRRRAGRHPRRAPRRHAPLPQTDRRPGRGRSRRPPAVWLQGSPCGPAASPRGPP